MVKLQWLLSHHRALVTRLLSQGYKLDRLSNTFKKFYGRQNNLLDNTRKTSVKCFLILPVKMLYFLFCGFVQAELIKLAKMTGVMHEADHAYSVQSTWWSYRLATYVPFIACDINSLSISVYNLDLSNLLLESGLSYFWVLFICLLLVYFGSAAGCCIDLVSISAHYMDTFFTKTFG